MLFLLLLDFSLSRSVTLRVIQQVARAGEKNNEGTYAYIVTSYESKALTL